MKYTNPGFPQIFEYQIFNDNVIGIDENHERSNTGYYLKLNDCDNCVFYKTVNLVDNFYILFDMSITKASGSTNFINDWVKVFDFYHDSDPNKNLQLCFKQYLKDTFEVNILTNSKIPLMSDPLYVKINEINTFELHVIWSNTTTIEVYVNGRLVRNLLDTSLYKTGAINKMNRINFYCNYVLDVNACISNIIYNDSNKIGNERIHMLTTDYTHKIIANNTSGEFTINELLDNSMYKDITGFGLITKVENEDTYKTEAVQHLDNQDLGSFKIESNQTGYNNAYVSTNTETKKPFSANEFSNKKIYIELSRK